MKQRAAREARAAARAAAREESESSGRSTPAHLKHIDINLPSDTEEDTSNKPVHSNHRTISETLKILDDDVVAERDVK